MSRFEDLKRFYEILDKLEHKVGGTRILANCDGRMGWPNRGVYFFRESGEKRSDTSGGARIVRVGISTATKKSKATLWNRLSQHKGDDRTGGGDHRTSVFRREVGEAVIKRHGIECPTWDYKWKQIVGIHSDIKALEYTTERTVSSVIKEMPFLWVFVDDLSRREYIEENATALLSNFGKIPLDKPSDTWLGQWSTRPKVKMSGQWNSNHVDKNHDPKFLEVLESAVDEMSV